MRYLYTFILFLSLNISSTDKAEILYCSAVFFAASKLISAQATKFILLKYS